MSKRSSYYGRLSSDASFVQRDISFPPYKRLAPMARQRKADWLLLSFWGGILLAYCIVAWKVWDMLTAPLSNL